MAASTNPLELKETFFSNLLLLGFDREAEEANHRLPLNRDMFLFPNKKAMEIVCHFLFCRLNPQLAYQEFRDCWPIINKKMEQQFRKSCHSWLSKLNKEEPDSSLPRTGPSLFLSPGGDRFYLLMFYFSTFVLRRVMAREHGKHGQNVHVACKKTSKNANMTRILSKAVKSKVLVEKNRFFEEVHSGFEVQEHWKPYAISSTKEHRKLTKEQRELERKLGPKDKSSMFEADTAAIHRTRKLQQVRELWKKIKHFYTDTKGKRAILDTIIEGSEECFRIDGTEVELQVPEVLTTEYQQYIQMNNIGNTYQAGKLNLLSMVQLCNLALHQLREQIIQVGIPNFEHSAPFVKTQLHGHAAYLANAQKLRSTLKDTIIPELKSSIEHFKKECYAYLDQDSQLSPAVALERFDFGLGLLPATPLLAFAPASQPLRRGEVSLPEDSLRKTPAYKDTPDVVESLTSSVREMVIKDERGKQIDKGLIEGCRAPKHFSKIPKPVNKKQSQTPVVPSRKQASVARRASLTNPRKPSKRDTTVASKTTLSSGTVPAAGFSPLQLTSVQGFKAALPGQGNSTVEKRFSLDGVRGSETIVHDEYMTPVRSGLKSALKKNPVSARNVLAEKIAKAVFADEPRMFSGNSSSQSSSGENTPKDIGVADPLENIHDTPFRSKDLIPRTPFKEDDHYGSKDIEEDSNIVQVTDNLEPSPSSGIITHAHLTPPDLTSHPTPLHLSSSVFRAEPACTFPPPVTPFSSPYVADNGELVDGGGQGGTPYSSKTPKQTRPFAISWKTPITSSSATRNKASYTPIESKLAAVDVHTTFTDLGTARITTALSVDRIGHEVDMRFEDLINSSEHSLNFLSRDGETHGGNLFELLETREESALNAEAKPKSADVPLMNEPRSTQLRSSIDQESRTPPLSSYGSENNTSLGVTEPQTHTPLRMVHFERNIPESEEHNGRKIAFYGAQEALPTDSTSTQKESAVRKPPGRVASASEASSINDLLLRFQRVKQQQQERLSPSVSEDEPWMTSSRMTPAATMATTTTPLLTTVALGNTIGSSGGDRLLFDETPSREAAARDNLSTFQFERDNVKSQLFLERSPLTSPYTLGDSPAAKLFPANTSPSGTTGLETKDEDFLSVSNNLLRQDLNLVSIDVDDDLFSIDGQLSPGVNNNNEHEKSSLETNTPVKTGLLIDFD